MRDRRTFVRHPRHPAKPPPSHLRRNTITGLVTLLVVPVTVMVVGDLIIDEVHTRRDPLPAATASKGLERAYVATAFTDVQAESQPRADPSTEPGASGSGATDPLAVTAEHIVTNVCRDAPGWRVPIEREQLGEPPAEGAGRSLYAWAMSRGGREISGTHLQLTLQGTTEDAVVVTGVETQILSQEPVSGPAIHVIPFGECGGEGDVHFMVLNLDERPAQWHPAEGVVENDRYVIRRVRNERPTPHTYEVSRGDGETFSFYACAQKYAYTWRLVIHWTTTDGKPHSTVVSDEGGRPFVTVPRPAGSAVTNSSVNRAGYRTDKTTWQDSGTTEISC